jgi:hypothetical protein
MTAQQEREYVEARFGKCVPVCDTTTMERGYGIFLGHEVHTIWRDESIEEAWHAAYLFTLDRERQIAEVEEEIALIESYISGQQKALDIPYELPAPKSRFVAHIAIFQRILAAEQQRLDALRTGWKGGK